MALLGLFAPVEQEIINPNFSFGTLNLSSVGRKVAVVCRVPKTGTITDLTIRTSTHVSNGVLAGGVYTVDSSGIPTATNYGGCVDGTVSVTGDNTYKITFSTPATVTAMDVVAFVVTLNSGSFRIVTNNQSYRFNFPYTVFYTTSWAKQFGPSAIMAFSYSGAYEYTPGMSQGYAASPVTFNSTSSPNEYGSHFVAPFKASLVGFLVYISFASSSSDCDVVLYDISGSAISTLTMSAGKMSASGSVGLASFRFPSAVSLDQGSTYYLMCKPQTSNNVTLQTLSLLNSVVSDQGISGSDFFLASKNGGTITPSSSTRAMVFPIFNDLILFVPKPYLYRRQYHGQQNFLSVH